MPRGYARAAMRPKAPPPAVGGGAEPAAA